MSSSSIDQGLEQFTYIASASIAICDLFVVVSIIIFTVCIELPRKQSPVTFASFFTKLNTLMLLMWSTGVVYATSITLYNYSKRTDKVSLAIGSLGFAISEAIYLRIAWIRSEDILKSMSSERVFQIFEKLLTFLPFASILPVALIFIPAEPNTLDFQLHLLFALGLGGTIVCFLDLYFVTSFMFYIQGLQKEMQGVRNVSPKLAIVAKWGFIATNFALCTLNCFVGAIVCLIVDPALENRTAFRVYCVLWALKDILIFVAALSWFLMKIQLVYSEGGNGSSQKNSSTKRNSNSQQIKSV